MGLLKFEEFINEGLWSSGMKRAENDERRQENKTVIDDYLKSIEWVDMGHPDVLFAKTDYKNDLSLDDIEKIEANLPEGVSIMKDYLYSWVNRNCMHFRSTLSYISPYNHKDEIFFNALKNNWSNNMERYFLNYDKNDIIQYLYYNPNENKLCLSDSHFIKIPANFKKFTIKLVKEKKSKISEGLWSSGMKRAESGEKRIGDLTTVDRFMEYIKTIDWVNMGKWDESGFERELYAKEDFNELLSYNDIKEILTKLPDDIKIAYTECFNHLSRCAYIKVDGDTMRAAHVINHKDEDGCINFYLSEHNVGAYFIEFRGRDKVYWRKLTPNSGMGGGFLMAIGDNEMDKPIFYIKLIKVVKPTNEGLWSSGMKRAENNELRKEDIKNNDNYIDLFLSKLGYRDFENFKWQEDNLLREMKKDDMKWTDDDFLMIMTAVGKLMDEYPNREFTGKFFCGPLAGYKIKGFTEDSYILLNKQFDPVELCWFHSTDHFSFETKGTEITPEERREMIDFIIDKAIITMNLKK